MTQQKKLHEYWLWNAKLYRFYYLIDDFAGAKARKFRSEFVVTETKLIS